MLQRLADHPRGIGDELQLAAIEFFPTFADVMKPLVAIIDSIWHTAHRRRAAEDDVSARSNHVGCDSKRFFAHPFRRKSDRWHLVNVIAESTVFNNLSH